MKEEGTYYPARDGEGLTVFMMGSIMLEYNRKPLQIPGGPSGKVLQLVPILLLFAGEEGVHREELLDMLYGNGENAPIHPGSLRATVFRLRKLLEGVAAATNISAQTEESTDGTAGNCRCTLMPGILRIRPRRPCAPMTKHS
ncbi:MAG: hypothetical protein ACLTBV_19435 [Enterocloster bolteae]